MCIIQLVHNEKVEIALSNNDSDDTCDDHVCPTDSQSPPSSYSSSLDDHIEDIDTKTFAKSCASALRKMASETLLVEIKPLIPIVNGD